MYELGPGADAFHRAVGEHCAAAGVRVVAVGELARGYLTGAPGERWFSGVTECIEALPEVAQDGSAVLVKASRALRLERVAQALAASPGSAAANVSGSPTAASPLGRATMLRAMGASVVAMVLMLVIGPPFIRWLRVNEFGQNIREEGPEGHKTKEGTPTMGGMLIWLAVIIPFIIFSRFSVASITVMIAALGNAAIGFADDWIKIVRKRSLGLAARYKLLLQLLLALFIGFIALHFVGLDTRVDVPFTSYRLELGGIGFYALIFLTLAGFSNAVNLTDGLDGLAAGASAIVLVALAGIAFIIGRNASDPGITDLMVVAGCIGGACLGFLWYNTFPADVFMGDTGSLGLGGAIAGLAVITRTEFVLLIIGGLFVIEAASVMAQVVSFKLFHRRVLLMAPLHHHFELKAWSETKIIVRFWIIAALFAGAGFAAYYATF